MKRLLAIGVFIVTAILSFVFGVVWRDSYGRLTAWMLVAGGVVAVVAPFAAGPGPSVKRFLTDERNRYSQPSLITLSWFVVIVSAYLSCAVWNIALWQPTTKPLPVAIEIPPSIWVLAGVVGVDLIATGIILLDKKRRSPSTKQEAEAQRLGMAEFFGTLFIRQGVEDARVSDLVTYDELGVQDTPDLAALQKLLFQITAVIVYAIALGRLIFSTPADMAILGFPEIPAGFLALLGVSTATAIVNRAVPR